MNLFCYLLKIRCSCSFGINGIGLWLHETFYSVTAIFSGKKGRDWGTRD